MKPSFLAQYSRAFKTIQGMSSFDAMLLFMAYNELIAARGVRGHTLEIGVHHGLSSIAVAALRGPGARFVAIDLFNELQGQNVSGSGLGDREIFLRNIHAFHEDRASVQVVTRPSGELRPEQLGTGFSFCHVDGGHSASETYADLALCSALLAPGGLLALDDYFNPTFPGVSEGAVRFGLENPGVLVPLAIGYNKVIYQKAAASELNAAFAERFPQVPAARAQMWDRPVLLFSADLGSLVDLSRSTPEQLVLQTQLQVDAGLAPMQAQVKARRGESLEVPVRVSNRSSFAFQWSDSPIGLSYHLLSSRAELLVHDNLRTPFNVPLPQGEERVVQMRVVAPAEPGTYLLEVDLVWEGVLWFKDRGSKTARVELVVS